MLRGLSLKQHLLGRSLGLIAHRLRQSWTFSRTLQTKPEIASWMAQDRCAELILTRLCESGESFIDVGAHIGSITAAVRAQNPSIQITAVEAVPEKADFLAQRFPDVTVHRCAAGEAAGSVPFHINTIHSACSSMLRDGWPGHSLTTIEVQMQPLDALLDADQRITVIKIDVEGAELRVLRGSAKTIERCRPAVCFESAAPPSESSFSDAEELHDWFTQRDYEILAPNRLAHFGPPLSRECFLEGHWYPRRASNYFAVPRERRSLFRSRARKALNIVGSATPSPQAQALLEKQRPAITATTKTTTAEPKPQVERLTPCEQK